MDRQQLREELAEIEHNQWWRWAKWMAQNEKVSPERLKRWEEKCFLPYGELTEHEKDKDRLQADLVIAFLEKYDLLQ